MAPVAANDISRPAANNDVDDSLPTLMKSDPSSKKTTSMPKPKVFDDKYQQRQYLKERLALAFRIFAEYGYDEGVAGHITLRDPVDPTTFWVNPFGKHFALMKASDLIRVSHSGEILDGGEIRLLNAAAFAIHSAIHDARPDVICAAHSHSVHGRAFCALGTELDIITQDSCAFYNDHVVYDQFNGVVVAEEEGREIAKCLGNKKAALLQNHGLLTVGKTIEETVFWFVSLDKCCHAQMLADATGKVTKKIQEEDAVTTSKMIGTPYAGWFSALPLFDWMEEKVGSKYKQ